MLKVAMFEFSFGRFDMKRNLKANSFLSFKYVQLILLIVAFNCGCGGNAGVTSVQLQDYRTIAKVLAQETKNSKQAFIEKKEMVEIIAEGQAAILDLRSIKTSDNEISFIAAQGESAMVEVVRRMETLNALPKPPSAASVVFESFIHGLYGNIFAGYAIGTDADNKQTAINNELIGLIAAMEKADAAHILLARVAEKLAAPKTSNSNRIMVNFEDIWGGSDSHHWLNLKNNGSEIQDCTILVEITGDQGEVRKNVHFVPKWAGDSRIYCRYDVGKTILDKSVGKQSVINTSKIDISIFSPNFSTKFTYNHEGLERNKHIQVLCDKTKFIGRYRPFKGGIIWDDQRAAYFKLDDGIDWLPKCQVEICFKKGSTAKTWLWEFDQWKKGEEKFFQTPKGELTFDPDIITFLVTFPNTNSKIDRSLKLN